MRKMKDILPLSMLQASKGHWSSPVRSLTRGYLTEASWKTQKKVLSFEVLLPTPVSAQKYLCRVWWLRPRGIWHSALTPKTLQLFSCTEHQSRARVAA